jgi:hypothetical protein
MERKILITPNNYRCVNQIEVDEVKKMKVKNQTEQIKCYKTKALELCLYGHETWC